MRVKSLFLLSSLLLVASVNTKAEEPAQPNWYGKEHWGVIFHMRSWHFEKGDSNNKNPGLGIRWNDDKNSWFLQAGGFVNSQENKSTYIGVGKNLYSYKSFEFALAGGAITGYEPENVRAFLIPEARLKLVFDNKQELRILLNVSDRAIGMSFLMGL